jgi:hypothetical protein
MRLFADSWPGAPWTRRTLVFAVTAMALGVLLVVVAWIGASGERQLSPQVVWVNLAVVGSAIAAVGQATWLLQGRRAVGVLRHQVLPDRERPRRPAAPPIAPVAATGVVAIAGSGRYHRPDCLLVAGKDVDGVDAARDGLQPCDVCQP